MAIDFMILPISRYISGDFVTPSMRLAWDQGIPYAVFGPDGRRDCPPGQPFGGADAPRRREAMQQLLQGDLEQLPPAIARALWDERSSAEPRFHRVAPTSYRALVEHAEASSRRRSFLGFPKRTAPAALHVTATLFLPCDFADVFEMTSPFARRTGAVKSALEALSSNDWPAETESARASLAAALEDADAVRLPVIVDW